jgi:hypothetical protein
MGLVHYLSFNSVTHTHISKQAGPLNNTAELKALHSNNAVTNKDYYKK